MDTTSLLFYLFVGIGIINMLHFCFYLTCANLYDIWQFKRKRRASALGPLPLVSVLVPAHNEEKVIVRCLTSILKSDYPKLQIIVIDDASADSTRSLVRSFLKGHPGAPIQLRWKNVNSGKAGALNHALRRTAKGELVMTLDADSLLAKHSISRAVSYFDDPKVVGVAANVRIIEEQTVLNFLQRFEHMIGYRSKKAHSLTNCEFIIGGVASTYRMSVLKKVGFYDTTTLTEDIGLSMKVAAQGNRQHRLVYGVDVVAMTEGVESFKALLKQRYRWKYGNLQSVVKYRRLIANPSRRYSRMLTFYRMPMAIFGEVILLLEPITLLYVLYRTVVSENLGLIIGAYCTITIYVLLNLWPDEHLEFKHRLRLSMYAFVAYFVFYIMNVVQLTAITRCLLNARRLASGKGTSHWVSPKRIGREVSLG